VLQCVAVCCSVLQCVAVCCSVLQCILGEGQCPILRRMCRFNVLHCVALCRNVFQRVNVGCNVLQCVTVCCSVLHFCTLRHTLHDLLDSSFGFIGPFCGYIPLF